MKTSNYFDFCRCYGNKNSLQNSLKIGNWPIWSKFARFDREINIEHKYQKDILTEYASHHGTKHIKSCFWYLAVPILSAIFVTIATVKFK